jgi:hypothetical protein
LAIAGGRLLRCHLIGGALKKMTPERGISEVTLEAGGQSTQVPLGANNFAVTQRAGVTLLNRRNTSAVKLSVLHKGSEKTLSLTLGELPESKEARADTGNSNNGVGDVKLGLTLAPAARVAGAGSEGVVVTGVDSSGVAADHGFSTGDVILEVAGKSVSTPADVREMVNSARTEGKRSVLLRVKKGDNTRFVALPVGRG